MVSLVRDGGMRGEKRTWIIPTGMMGVASMGYFVVAVWNSGVLISRYFQMSKISGTRVSLIGCRDGRRLYCPSFHMFMYAQVVHHLSLTATTIQIQILCKESPTLVCFPSIEPDMIISKACGKPWYEIFKRCSYRLNHRASASAGEDVRVTTRAIIDPQSRLLPCTNRTYTPLKW